MTLDRKLQLLKKTATVTQPVSDLRLQLDYLRKLESRAPTVPAERFPHGIETYVEGELCSNSRGEFFLARQTLPFGRPYGKARIGDVATADLTALQLFLPGQALPPSGSIVYLDTETTGLAGGTGTCAFLIGLGSANGCGFEVRQFFLRELDEEKAVLFALAEALEPFQAIITFNGRTFDLPLLEAQFTLARLRSPFPRLLHLDLLPPARRMWKLRLERCELKRLEHELLKVKRDGDVDGADIPHLYFNYLRTGNPRGLQPVFFHNAMDIVTLAALAAELNRTIIELANDEKADGRDLLSLSRIFSKAGVADLAATICEKSLGKNLPEELEVTAVWQLAFQYKRERRFERAVPLWLQVARAHSPFSFQACEQLAIYYEHRKRDPIRALEFAEAARQLLNVFSRPDRQGAAILHRVDRLRKKIASKSPRLVQCLKSDTENPEFQRIPPGV